MKALSIYAMTLFRTREAAMGSGVLRQFNHMMVIITLRS